MNISPSTNLKSIEKKKFYENNNIHKNIYKNKYFTNLKNRWKNR